ncbi:alanine racemase [Sneathia vaginalis]|uniref:alanine racemase n=1 Tax=Sneathia TaxID=168808 RepID=UPI001D00A02C|nr:MULTISPECIES: alanine racemase [Sneathia]MDK9581587.1 alanine racemase [Sneathia vaginalis]
MILFLKRLLDTNKAFVDASLNLYKKGLILPDSYCIDVDMFLENAKNILNEAKKYNINLFYMLKQVGRNPYLAKKLEDLGYKGAVCVDFKEVEVMMKNNLKLCNIGHLVQIPKNMLSRVIEYGVEIITVYSYDMIKEISNIALSLNKTQDIMLRILDENSEIYPGQEAGFSVNEVKELIPKLKDLKGVKLNGITSFPCFLYSPDEKCIKETNNLFSVLEVNEFLKKQNLYVKHINLPSVSTVENIKKIYSYGGTDAEPGHALTGTTPLNIDSGVEIPAYLYISEISHVFKNNSHFYGGGYYPRGHMKHGYIDNKIVNVNNFNATNIDYYLSLEGKYNIFDPIILCFRTQMFVTRSDIVLIEGIHSNNIHIVGIYNTQGDKKNV